MPGVGRLEGVLLVDANFVMTGISPERETLVGKSWDGLRVIRRGAWLLRGAM